MISCVTESSYNIPVPFTDTSGLTIDYDNFGTATISFTIIHSSSQALGGGQVTFSINGINFVAYVEAIAPAPIEGTDYFETKIVVKGFGC